MSCLLALERLSPVVCARTRTTAGTPSVMFRSHSRKQHKPQRIQPSNARFGA